MMKSFQLNAFLYSFGNFFPSPALAAFLQFNCFLLMPVVDKLPALLREDLESAFEDDLDNVFDITNLRHSLGQQKRETEIELRRVFIHICHLRSSIILNHGIFFLAFLKQCIDIADKTT